MLDLLVQDHADLDEVEALAALWAIAQADDAHLRDHACEALLACAAQLMHGSDGAQLFLDLHLRWIGPRASSSQATWPALAPAAAHAFARVERLALHDAELAARLALFR